VFATDISEEMLTIARRRTAEQGVSSGISFKVMDIEDLQFENNFFEAASCMETFVHLPSPTRVMSALVRVVKPGGMAVSRVTLPVKKRYLNANRISNFDQLFEWLFTPVYQSSIYQNGFRRTIGHPGLVGRPPSKDCILRLFKESGLSVQRGSISGIPSRRTS